MIAYTNVLLPVLALATSVLAPATFGQSILYTFDGDSPNDIFGLQVSGAGDVNGDGYADVIVGAPWDKIKNKGSAWVFSGADGSTLYTWYGGPDEHLGSVSGAGDVNQDGFDDVIVGSRANNPAALSPVGGFSQGLAVVYSGKTGLPIHRFPGRTGGSDSHGSRVSGAGDVDGDGYPDLIVGASNADNNGKGSGIVYVYSGKLGTILHLFEGQAAGDRFGMDLSGAGDVNGDGFADIIVGAFRADVNVGQSGSAFVFSGKDGTVLHALHGESFKERLGKSVGAAGDVNGDGFDDFIVGAYTGDYRGRARVYSGKDGSIIYSWEGASVGDVFGGSVAGAGDVNGDNIPDLIVGAHVAGGTGRVYVFSGATGAVLLTIDGTSYADAFGGSVDGAGDINGDGLADLIVGAPSDDNNGQDSGSATVYSGCDSCGPIGQNYCGPANLNSTGQSAVISAFGRTEISWNFVTLTASLLPQNEFGYFLNSDVQDFKPFPPGSSGNLCLGGGIGRHVKQIGNSGAAGELVIDVDLTALPRPGGSHSVVAGETWNFQCWFRDNQGGPTSNFTDGIEIVFK